ncbi:MAG: YkyA family protein, partial [Candidatus Omnitrophica bacterium]|nr:YkyA family protein [Candidatus Omnitrophota bacterium]
MGIFVVMGLVSPIYAGRLPLGLDKPGDIIPQGSGNINRVVTPPDEDGVILELPTWEIIGPPHVSFRIELDKLRTTIQKDERITLIKEYTDQIKYLSDEVDKLINERGSEIQKVISSYDEKIAELKASIEELNELKKESMKEIFKEFIEELKKAIKEGRYGDILQIVKDYITAVKAINEGYNSAKKELEDQIKELEKEKEEKIRDIDKKFSTDIGKLIEAIGYLEEERWKVYSGLKDEVENKIKNLCMKYRKRPTPEMINKYTYYVIGIHIDSPLVKRELFKSPSGKI